MRAVRLSTPTPAEAAREYVEVADIPTAPTIAIRDSKKPAGPMLTLDPAAFSTFLNWTTAAAHNR